MRRHSHMRLFALVLLGLLTAVQRAASEGGRHCCAAREGRSALLACEATPNDKIVAVSLAALLKDDGRDDFCAAETTPCGQEMLRAAEASCVGQRRCVLSHAAARRALDLEAASSLTSTDATSARDCKAGEKLAVQWKCASDGQSLGDPLRELPPLPLKANGSAIRDANGNRVRIRGVNWGEAHNVLHVPSGLDRAPLDHIVRLIAQLGFNQVRLPFSLEAVRSNPVVLPGSVAANPELRGKRALDVMDAVVAALAKENILIFLDQHMLDAEWCCSNYDMNGLWFNGRHSEDDWIAVLGQISRRYANVSAVVGLQPKNEVRKVCAPACNTSLLGDCEDFSWLPGGLAPEACVEAGWSSGPVELQYKRAMERAGRAILAGNPRLLVTFGGMDYSSTLTSVVWDPPDLPRDRLVYEVHEYSWFHSLESVVDTGSAYQCKLAQNWDFLLRENIAPVLVSEYGFAHRWMEDEGPRAWFKQWQSYATEKSPVDGGLDLSYWQLSGLQAGGHSRQHHSIETFGILNECWTAPADDTHFAALTSLQEVDSNSTRVGALPGVLLECAMAQSRQQMRSVMMSSGEASGAIVPVAGSVPFILLVLADVFQ
eukprot:TRINITY_DN13036_c0_g1_i1.p1 TRINITY_DN13036_c0_g1~~TRINITY_DN13036_c0_g1_i1.p1  ORF type:complete len:600 (-),score=108.14 TRINITY_DN13036_c0_g1_i1:257-2056(-)